jgi:hypothetical protein
MTCPSCGREVAAGAKFCGYCGAAVTGAASAAERFAAEIVPPRILVAAGSEAGAEVVVRNTGTVVEHVALTVGGDAAAWSGIDPPALRIMPGESATAALLLRPPRSSAAVAGSHALIVQAAPVDNPGVAGQANAIVDVAPFDLVAARVVPQQATRWRGSTRRLELSNGGNAPVAVRVTATDPDDAMTFTGLPPEATVAPGQPVALVFRAAARRWRPLGRKPVPRDFSVAATSADGAVVAADGVLLQRAVFNLFTGLLAIVALLLVIVILVVIVLIVSLLSSL